MAFLKAKMAVAAGVSVVYRRQATGISYSFTAWVGRTVFAQEAKTPGGASIVWGERDYIFAVESLADSTPGGLICYLPMRGDQIEEVVTALDVETPDRIVPSEATFELFAPGTNEPCWRFSDQTRALYRCHCRRVS